MFVPEAKRDKLDHVSEFCTFRLCSAFKRIEDFNLNAKKIDVARSVRFNEGKVWD